MQRASAYRTGRCLLTCTGIVDPPYIRPHLLTGPSRAVTSVPFSRAVRREVAPALVSERTGIVIVLSAPFTSGGNVSGPLSDRITPIAPASCAFLTLTV